MSLTAEISLCMGYHRHSKEPNAARLHLAEGLAATELRSGFTAQIGG